MSSRHFVADKYIFNGTPYFSCIVEPPISWRVKNERSYGNRVRMDIEEGIIRSINFIELRVTSLTILILFQRSVNFMRKKRKISGCTYTTSSLQAFPSNLASYFSPVCKKKKNFQVYRDKVSTPPFSSRTFQIPCPGRSLVFCTFLLSLVSQSS